MFTWPIRRSEWSEDIRRFWASNRRAVKGVQRWVTIPYAPQRPHDSECGTPTSRVARHPEAVDLAFGQYVKVENLDAACDLHIGNYNFCRRQDKMRVTPAMAAGVADRLWSFKDLCDSVNR